MKQEKAYKIKLIKILEMLRQDSDEDHYIESTEILSKLAAMGIECDRRTLYGDIDVLNDFGYEVLCEKNPGKPNKYCVVDRSFDVPELRILMDAVQASSFITPSKTEVLLDKIADLGGSHRAELLRSNIVKFNMTKSANESIFYSISEINLAIENNKKVRLNTSTSTQSMSGFTDETGRDTSSTRLPRFMTMTTTTLYAITVNTRVWFIIA